VPLRSASRKCLISELPDLGCYPTLTKNDEGKEIIVFHLMALASFAG